MTGNSPFDIKERPPFLNNLKYGNLYVFHHPQSPLMQRSYRRFKHREAMLTQHFLGMPIVFEERNDINPGEVYVAARRFNLGNVGEDAVTWACFNVTQSMVDMALRLLERQILHFDDDTSGDIHFDDYFFGLSEGFNNSAPIPPSCAAPATESFAEDLKVLKSMRISPQMHIRYSKNPHLQELSCEDEVDDGDTDFKNLNKDTEEERIEETKLAALEERRQQDLAKLQAIILNYITTYHEDPSALIAQHLKGKYILKPGEDNLSRLVVNGDLQIVLPDWNEKVLPMHALARTLYILFLRHPEGIVLKDIGDYRQELLEIYNIVKPGRDEALAVRAIDSLTAPFSDTLSQNLSRIKRAVKTAILDDDTARHYYIDGRRGQPYRIDLPQHLVTLPAIFKP